MFVIAVVSLAAGAVALALNAAAGHWRLAAFNVGCLAIISLYLERRSSWRSV